MTISYTAQVSNCKRFGCFWKLLFWWRGSIYKLLWPNLMVYVMLYTTFSFTYRFLLNKDQRTTFENLSLHCQTYSDLIPVSFVLGFYVSIVIKRWWDQYMTIPWPDALAVYVSTFISGQDERARLMRRTIMRYANLSLLLAFRMMSPTVKKRFPTLDHLVEAGFLLKNEKDIFENLDMKTSHPKYWLPCVWATAIMRRARREGKIPDDFALKTLIDEVVKFRGGCGGLLNYDWISIPLVYTQVVTLAVYSYFAASLMGNQYLDPSKGYPNHRIDLIIPIFTFLQFFFYMGWLLVAETLVNPFGEDDDDFEVNWLIDRNLQISYVIVDEMHEEHPELIKDQYWDEVIPSELPYTEAAKQYHMEPFLGSAYGVAVPENMQTFITLSEEVEVLITAEARGYDMILKGMKIKPVEEGQDLDLWKALDSKAKELLISTLEWFTYSHVKQQLTYETSEYLLHGKFLNYQFENKFPGKQIITMILMSLPYEWKHFVSSWESGERAETTPVLINGPTRKLRESISTFQMMGSSLSLPLKKWRRSSLKPVCSQPYSMNSISKLNEEDFPDDVFSMSGLSFGSNKRLATQISLEKEHSSLKKKDPISESTKKSDSSDGSSSPYNQSNSSRIKENEQIFHGEDQELKNGSKQGDDSNIERKKCAMQLWTGSEPLPMPPTLEDNDGVLDINYIKNVTGIECPGLEYDTINILFPEVETLLGPRSEPVDIPPPYSHNSKDDKKKEETENESFVKQNRPTH